MDRLCRAESEAPITKTQNPEKHQVPSYKGECEDECSRNVIDVMNEIVVVLKSFDASNIGDNGTHNG